MITVVLCVLSLVASCHGYRLVEEDGVVDYTGFKTIRVDLSGSAGAAAVVREWVDEERVDVLNEGIGNEADLLVGPTEWESITGELENLGALYEVQLLWLPWLPNSDHVCRKVITESDHGNHGNT